MMMMFRSLFFMVFLATLSLSLFLSLSLSLVSAQTAIQLEPIVDRYSATSARVRFLNAPPSQQQATLIQYSNVTTHLNLNRLQFHSCATSAATGCPNANLLSEGGREINITQVGLIPITSYILRGLTPSTTYFLRLAYIDTTGQVQGTAGTFQFDTSALSPDTTLNSLSASGGCGSFSSGSGSSWLTLTVEGGVQVYTCRVVDDTNIVILSVVPSTAYATITPSNEFSNISQTLAVDAKQVDPLTIYTHNITLGASGSTTNYSFVVNSESQATQTYRLSIVRVPSSGTSSLAGPSSTVTALLRTPSVATNFTYRALLWSGTSVDRSSWKVWSDDLTVFPFSSFNITFNSTLPGGGTDYTLATVSVTPATSNPVLGSCSNIVVGLFDNKGTSTWISTCASALNDYCSATPFGAATKWPNFYENGVYNSLIAYYPAPPTPTFPTA